MSKRDELLKKRDGLLAEARTLLDTAATEASGMTDADEAKYHDLMAKHDDLMAQVKGLNDILAANAEFERQAAVTVPVSQTTATAVALGTMPAETPGAAGAMQPGRRSHRTPDSAPSAFGDFAFASVFAAQGRQSFGSGGLFVPEGLQPDLWQTLAPASVAIAAGIRVLSVADNTIIPSVSSQPEAAWVGEDSTIPPTSTGFKGTKIFFKKLASRQVVENDLIRSADRDVSAMLLGEQSRALALQLDKAIFEADGTQHAILGLKHRDDIISTAAGTDGAALADLDKLITMLSVLEANNATPNGWVMHPMVWGDLMKLRDQTSSLRPLLGEMYGVSGTAGIARKLLGLPVHLSSQLSIDEEEGSSGAVCRSIYCAQWDQVILARDAKQQVYLDIDEGELFSKDQTQLRALVRVDLAVPNPRAVYRLRGVKAAS